MLPFQALFQNDNKVQMISEAKDIVKLCCLIHENNISVQGRKINVLAVS